LPSTDVDLPTVLGQGDPEAVAALITAGADVRYVREHGYAALIDAVHGRDVARDGRLLDLLRLLIANGVDLDAVTSYGESGLRVLSRIGRFDAVQLLLASGADRGQLGWTPLIEAVVSGSLHDVERLVGEGASLEEIDSWARTPFLISLVAGDLAKAEKLRNLGANLAARGPGGTPPLFYAIESHHPHLVRWLLEVGQDVDDTDDYLRTPLLCAVEAADLECVDVLLEAGANVDHESSVGSVLGAAETLEITHRLLAAGADPRHLSPASRRALCGLGADDQGLATVSAESFRRAPCRVFGTANPERVRQPFWEAMIRSGLTAWEAATHFGRVDRDPSPVWSASRFGQSLTLLDDGRRIQIGGEHEDHYDRDFCIYNDVFLHGADGTIAIFGYPETVFPPTDFHTATLVDDAIYVIGSLGYLGTRRYGHTPVYRLDLRTFRIDPVLALGEAPGWIHRHRAVHLGRGQIRVSGGKVVTSDGAREVHSENTATFIFDVGTRRWLRQP
jgi:ankyrin repeat protein